MLLSPVGVPVKPETSERLVESKNHKGPPKWVINLANTSWEQQWSPFGIMRKSGSWMGQRLLRWYMKVRMTSLCEEEFNDLHKYM